MQTRRKGDKMTIESGGLKPVRAQRARRATKIIKKKSSNPRENTLENVSAECEAIDGNLSLVVMQDSRIFSPEPELLRETTTYCWMCCKKLENHDVKVYLADAHWEGEDEKRKMKKVRNELKRLKKKHEEKDINILCNDVVCEPCYSIGSDKRLKVYCSRSKVSEQSHSDENIVIDGGRSKSVRAAKSRFYENWNKTLKKSYVRTNRSPIRDVKLFSKPLESEPETSMGSELDVDLSETETSDIPKVSTPRKELSKERKKVTPSSPRVKKIFRKPKMSKANSPRVTSRKKKVALKPDLSTFDRNIYAEIKGICGLTIEKDTLENETYQNVREKIEFEEYLSDSPVCVEICVDNIYSAESACKGGANRLELCSALSEGGLTPSAGFLREVKSLYPIPVFVMIRPRGGDYCYNVREIDSMKWDIQILKEHGADGFVFGALDKFGEVDKVACRTLIQAAHPFPCTFHRAFDQTVNPYKSLETIVRLGFTRILTSGQQKSAIQGAELIKLLAYQSEGFITIMAGAGVNPSNVADLIKETNITEVHCSARKKLPCLSKAVRYINTGSNFESEGFIHVADMKTVEDVVRRANACFVAADGSQDDEEDEEEEIDEPMSNPDPIDNVNEKLESSSEENTVVEVGTSEEVNVHEVNLNDNSITQEPEDRVETHETYIMHQAEDIGPIQVDQDGTIHGFPQAQVIHLIQQSDGIGPSGEVISEVRKVQSIDDVVKGGHVIEHTQVIEQTYVLAEEISGGQVQENIIIESME